jgi:hypothetical protein
VNIQEKEDDEGCGVKVNCPFCVQREDEAGVSVLVFEITVDELKARCIHTPWICDGQIPQWVRTQVTG